MKHMFWNFKNHILSINYIYICKLINLINQIYLHGANPNDFLVIKKFISRCENL